MIGLELLYCGVAGCNHCGLPATSLDGRQSQRQIIETFIRTNSIKLIMTEATVIIIQSRSKACATCITRKTKVAIQKLPNALAIVPKVRVSTNL
jgi:hypothetical protein